MKKKNLWNLYKSKSKSKADLPIPVSCIREVQSLLEYFNTYASNLDHDDSKHKKQMARLCQLLREIKLTLYGTNESEPVPEACAQLTEEFFKNNTFRLLVLFLPHLNLEARNDATHVVANLQRQQVKCCLVACTYLDKDMDLVDVLVAGYDDHNMALHYGRMLRECIRHQTVANYVLEGHLMKFFRHISLPYFEISSDAFATFKELLTRHKSTVADFLSQNYNWIFEEYNTKLLQSPVYVIRRQAVKLLGEIFLVPANAKTMEKYVSSKENFMMFMNLLKHSHALRSGTEITEVESCAPKQEPSTPSKVIQLDAFHVFKLFVFNENKPPEIEAILIANCEKLLPLLNTLSLFMDEQKSYKSEVDEKQGMVARQEFKKDISKVAREIEGLVHLELQN